MLSKKSLVDSTASLGQTLESFVTNGNISATPTPLLSYPLLRQRYEALQTQLDQKKKDIEKSIGKASDLKYVNEVY